MTARPESSSTRRDFIKGTAAASAALWHLANTASLVSAIDDVESSEDSPSVLIDISRCTGCNACALACKESNHALLSENPPARLDAETYSFVDEREVVNRDGEQVARYVKRQCMHCLNPACASACPAAAMHLSDEGPVLYTANRCLGCRYCQIACPFGVPQFDWDNGLTPKISKCWMCIDRLRAGNQPACVEACPTGALRFGRRKSMLRSARARIGSNPDRYIDHVYGEHEVGGTSMLYLSDVPFEQLGLPTDLPTTAPSEETARIMTKLPSVISVLGVALSGAAVYARHREPADAGETED